MTATHHTSPDRREAISRAASAVVRLRVEPSVQEPAHRQNAIVNDPRFSDREAWDAVMALESMLVDLGIVEPQEIEAARNRQSGAHPCSSDFTTTTDMWRQQGRAMQAYDGTGKTLAQLAGDYLTTHAAYAVATQHVRNDPGDRVDALQAELLLGRLALIEEAIESLGGAIDAYRDEGDARIYGPNWVVLARF